MLLNLPYHRRRVKARNESMRVCKVCEELKPIAEFSRVAGICERTYHTHTCHDCERAIRNEGHHDKRRRAIADS